MKCLNLILLSLLLVAMLVSACAPPVYEGYIDVSKLEKPLEFTLATGYTLQGKLSVYEGTIVFVVTDSWGHHIEDKVVKAGEACVFSVKAKQSGEYYQCWFSCLPGEEKVPRWAVFHSNIPPDGWD